MQTSDISFLHIRRFGDRDTKVSITKCYNEYNNCIIVHFKISDPKNRVYFFYFSSALNLKKKTCETIEVINMFSDILLCNYMSFFENSFFEDRANPLHNTIIVVWLVQNKGQGSMQTSMLV